MLILIRFTLFKFPVINWFSIFPFVLSYSFSGPFDCTNWISLWFLYFWPTKDGKNVIPFQRPFINIAQFRPRGLKFFYARLEMKSFLEIRERVFKNEWWENNNLHSWLDLAPSIETSHLFLKVSENFTNYINST